MSRMVTAAKSRLAVRELAQRIIAPLPNKAYPDEAKALQNWVRDNVRYTRDVNGVETLQTPEATLRTMQGDCDDHAILLASLLESVGHPTRFRAIAAGSPTFNHVFTETRIGPKWLSVETTEPWPMGYLPGNIRKSMYEHN
jgi:transglutaminase-like putative cysteine protease